MSDDVSSPATAGRKKPVILFRIWQWAACLVMATPLFTLFADWRKLGLAGAPVALFAATLAVTVLVAVSLSPPAFFRMPIKFRLLSYFSIVPMATLLSVYVGQMSAVYDQTPAGRQELAERAANEARAKAEEARAKALLAAQSAEQEKQAASEKASAQGATPASAGTVVVPVGKAIVVDDLEIALRSVKLKNQIGYPGIGPAANTGETFVVANYTFMNVGTKPASELDYPTVELIDGTGQVYAKDREATSVAAALSDANHSSELNPKVLANQITVWKVSKSAFDPTVWKLKVSFDQGALATIRKAARWPLDTTFPAPVMLELQAPGKTHPKAK